MNTKRTWAIFSLLFSLALVGGIYVYFSARPSADVFAVAGAGKLDTTFGEAGIVQTDFGGKNNSPQKTFLQKDGKLLVAGNSYVGRQTFLTLARYQADGRLDPTFGTDGYKIFESELPDFRMTTGVALDDDKVLLGGTIQKAGGKQGFGFIRLLPNGDLDTFGTNGLLAASLSDSNDYLQSMVLYDDKLTIIAQSVGQVVLARYHLDGSLDQTFGQEGKATIGSNKQFFPTNLFVRSDKTLIVAGAAHNTLGYDGPYVLQFDNNGLPLVSSNPIIDLSDGAYNINRYVMGADGALYGTGESANSNPAYPFQFATIKIDLTTGKLDQGFGSNGVATADFSQNAASQDLVVQTTGDLIVGGQIGTYPDVAYALVRYTPQGKLDTTFGKSGLVKTTFADHGSLTSLVLDPEDNVFAVGVTQPASYFLSGPPSSTTPETTVPVVKTNDFLIAKYLGNAVTNTSTTSAGLDANFGTNGALKYNFGNTFTSLFTRQVAVDPNNGDVVAVGGATAEKTAGDITTLSGSYVMSVLDNVGLKTTEYGRVNRLWAVQKFSDATSEMANAVAFAGRNTVVGGQIWDKDHTQGTDFYLAAFDSYKHGYTQIVTDFGLKTSQGDRSQNDEVLALRSVSQRNIVAAGKSVDPRQIAYDGAFFDDVAIAHYNLDSSLLLDTAFNGTGKLTISTKTIFPSADTVQVLISDMAIQPNGKILVLANVTNQKGYSSYALFRLQSGGTLDQAFGTNGIVQQTLEGGVDLYGYKVYSLGSDMNTDGSVIISGILETNARELALVKFNSLGVTDTGFGTSGVVSLQYDQPNVNDWAYPEVAFDGHSGKIAMGIAQGTYGSKKALTVAQYTAQGQPDTSFGSAGTGINQLILDESATIDGLAFLSNGQLLVVGTTTPGESYGWRNLIALRFAEGVVSVAKPTSVSPSATTTTTPADPVTSTSAVPPVSVTPTVTVNTLPFGKVTVVATPTVEVLPTLPPAPATPVAPIVAKSPVASAPEQPVTTSSQLVPDQKQQAAQTVTQTVTGSTTSATTTASPTPAPVQTESASDKLAKATSSAAATAAAKQMKAEAQTAYTQKLADATKKKDAAVKAAGKNTKAKAKATTQFTKDKAAATKTLAAAKKDADKKLKAKLAALKKATTKKKK